MKKLRFVRTLEYYDVPQIFTCEDDDAVNFLCMLYDITNSGELNAIGVSVSKDRLSEFINGNVDLLAMFITPESKDSIFSVQINEYGIYAEKYEDELESFMLPDEGYFYNKNDKYYEHTIKIYQRKEQYEFLNKTR